MARRRGHGEGSIYQRDSDGLWCSSVNLGYVNGKRRRKVIYGMTRKEVAEKLKVALRDQKQGLPVAMERQTIGQFLERWLEEVVKLTTRPKTHATYAQVTRLYITPALAASSWPSLSRSMFRHCSTLKQRMGSRRARCIISAPGSAGHLGKRLSGDW